MEKKSYEIQLGEGKTLYFEQFDQLQPAESVHDGRKDSNKFAFATETLKQAVDPLTDLLSPIQETARSMGVSEMELSMQLELAANGEIPVFKVLSFGSSCQIAVKFVWKKEDGKTTSNQNEPKELPNP